MKIIQVTTILTSPNQNYLFVKIITDSGVYGVGDASLNGPGTGGSRPDRRLSDSPADREGSRPDRGFLAAGLPRHLLAGREYYDERAVRNRHGVVGYSGKNLGASHCMPCWAVRCATAYCATPIFLVRPWKTKSPGPQTM